MKLIVSEGINGVYVYVCIFQGGDRLAAHRICSSFLPSSSPLLLPFFSESVISRRTHGELSWGREGKGHEKSLITAALELMK